MRVPRVGDKAERSMTITDEHIEAFARLSGDRNPVHFDDSFAQRIGFEGHIAHGAVTASLLSAVLGMDLPGPGSVFLEQRIRFLAPVRPGDTITATLEVTKIRPDKPIVTLGAKITNQAGTAVVDGELVVLVRDPGPLTRLDEVRRMKDEFFALDPDSPLTDEQRESFTGLRYFDADASLHYEVVLDRTGAGPAEEVQTSDGSVQVMKRSGILRFSLTGKDVTLIAYDQGHKLFVPFRDATSGGETYGSGRYVEAEPIGHETYDLDFNAAYNPYCAYNEDWVCPLPPRENWLDVPIRAGEKTFH
jgi:uncharacterized protein (DUF1684 family)